MNLGADQSDRPAYRLGPADVLWLAALYGLAGGELEVASRVVRRAFSMTDRMYLLTRHFFWLVPLIDLALFVGFGILCAVANAIMAATGRLAVSQAGCDVCRPAGPPDRRPRGLPPGLAGLRDGDRPVALARIIKAPSGRDPEEGDLDVRGLADGGGNPGQVESSEGEWLDS